MDLFNKMSFDETVTDHEMARLDEVSIDNQNIIHDDGKHFAPDISDRVCADAESSSCNVEPGNPKPSSVTRLQELLVQYFPHYGRVKYETFVRNYDKYFNSEGSS